MPKGVEDYDRVLSRVALDERLAAFVAESNRIEGIHRPPTDAEINAHRTLIARKRVKVEHVTALVAVCQPNAVLRATTDVHGVRVGNHVAPPSGPNIVRNFEALLAGIASGELTPWEAHVQYETLHPYRPFLAPVPPVPRTGARLHQGTAVPAQSRSCRQDQEATRRYLRERL